MGRETCQGMWTSACSGLTAYCVHAPREFGVNPVWPGVWYRYLSNCCVGQYLPQLQAGAITAASSMLVPADGNSGNVGCVLLTSRALQRDCYVFHQFNRVRTEDTTVFSAPSNGIFEAAESKLTRQDEHAARRRQVCALSSAILAGGGRRCLSLSSGTRESIYTVNTEAAAHRR
eukprot:6130775-Amphidinium_carterae.1